MLKTYNNSNNKAFTS